MLPPLSRRKAEVLEVLSDVESDDHENLKKLGAENNKFWSTEDKAHAPLIAAFRSEVKAYYWGRQARRCCYCSKELDGSKASYDAEHILSKDEFPQFMFELGNLSVACKTCNGVKKNKNVLVLNVKLESVPVLSSEYSIVHPHLDEWSDHFKFDNLNRIVPLDGDAKGAATIEICGINYLNAARLADHFLPADHGAIQAALAGFFRAKRRGWKVRYLHMLQGLVVDLNYEPARQILGALEAEL